MIINLKGLYKNKDLHDLRIILILFYFIHFLDWFKSDIRILAPPSRKLAQRSSF